MDDDGQTKQPAGVNDRFQPPPALATAQVDLTDVWMDLHGRFDEPFVPQAVLVRPGITWRALPNLFLTVGYGWTPSWTPVAGGGDFDLDLVDEHRIWEQLIYKPKDPETDHLFQLYSLFAADAEAEAMAATYRRGGFGYGEVKKALADAAREAGLQF